jgi:branched-chain amino acid transport system ATP-binding protein
MLSVGSLAVSFGSVRAVDGVDLEVEAGTIAALVGRNGAGKSSLLSAISGLVPRQGRVAVDGVEVPARRPDLAVRAGLAHVPEGRRVFADLTVAENLRVAAAASGTPRERRGAIEAHCLELFPVLGNRLGQLGWSLSGGEQQALAISRAMMMEPRLIVMDEPTLGLAPKYHDAVAAAARSLAAAGTAVVLAEQNVRFALRACDRIWVLHRGRWAVAAASPDEVSVESIGDTMLAEPRADAGVAA